MKDENEGEKEEQEEEILDVKEYEIEKEEEMEECFYQKGRRGGVFFIKCVNICVGYTSKVSTK